MAVACPAVHYVEIQPWRQLTKTRQCLVAHGIYDRTYRGSLTVLLAKPTPKPLTIRQGQVLARVQAVPQSVVGDIRRIDGANLGIETPVGIHLHTNVTIEELEADPPSMDEESKIDLLIAQVALPAELTAEQTKQLRHLIHRNLPTFSMHAIDLGRTS
jgi:hypothetical protein